jgi:hypothetical protein
MHKNNQAPRNNNQTMTDSQIPTSKQKINTRLVIDYWSLKFVWNLSLGYWSFIKTGL